MKLDEFFPHQVCINLDTRPDRWQRVTARFFEHGVNRVSRFPAVDGRTVEVPPNWAHSPGAYGCLRSHLAVIEQARDQERSSVLIFEDDVVLAHGFSARFSNYVQQLPEDWDMLYFGAIHGVPLIKVDRNVIRVWHSLSTYAYALKQTIYDDFIALNRPALTVLDESTRALQKRFNCYCFMPHLAWVEEDYSDVQGERSQVWWLKESLVLFGPEMDEILQSTVAVISYCNKKPGSFRNLRFTLNYFLERLPTVTLFVLEHGTAPSVNLSNLPHGCQYAFVEDAGCGNPGRALQPAVERFTSGKEFFIFLDSDLFLTREDIRANLLKCRDYDVASSCLAIYDLNDHDTLKILQGDLRWDYEGTGQPRPKTSIYDSCYIITRTGVRTLLDLKPSDGQTREPCSQGAQARLRVYHSPNPARRLSCS